MTDEPKSVESKKHMTFCPSSWAIEEYKGRLTDFETTEHRVQLTPAKPLPDELIEDLVRFHAERIGADRQ